MTGVELITAERQRQVAGEGWTPEHDDQHTHGELVRAAICYAALASGNHSRLVRSITELEIGVRAYGCLKSAHIYSVGELAAMTDSELLKLKNLGRRSLNQIKQALIKEGLSLGMKNVASEYWPWPWEGDWWKPSNDPIRNLTKAGALIAAEIDRLQRKAGA